MRLKRASKWRRLPSARAIARSRNSAAARVYSAEHPSRQAFRQRPVQSHGFGALQVLVDGARRDRAASPNLLMAQSKFITEAKDLIFRMDSLLAGKRILPFPGEVCPPL